jgi:hypothetical protein
MAEEKKYKERVFINLHKSFCSTFKSKVDGSMVNRMTIPKGTVLNGEDIGGCRIRPKYMNENSLDKNMMTATFYISYEGKGEKVQITNDEGWSKYVDVHELKAAMDKERQQYAEKMAAGEIQSRAQAAEKDKNRGEELE